MSDRGPALKRRLALYLVCLGMLMTVLDVTVVTVAMPKISEELQISGPDSTWVMNAYTLFFAGCLLLAGKLGDEFGAGRVFLIGIAIFTLASVACGAAHTKEVLLSARAAQGVGGAIVAATSLTLLLSMFTEPADRARALSLYAFMTAAGAGLGELVGGMVTQVLNWSWAFFINVPIGLLVFGLCTWCLPTDTGARRKRLDVAGAVTVTAATVLLVHTLGSVHRYGWVSVSTVTAFAAVAGLVVLFVCIEKRTSHPLVPLRFFESRTFTLVAFAGVLWSAGSFAWFVTCAIYLHGVLAYSPMQVALALLPAMVAMGLFAAGAAARVVVRSGVARPLVVGLMIVSLGLLTFTTAHASAEFWPHVFPGVLLQGLGSGAASTAFYMAATRQLRPEDTGLGSGLINMTMLLGSAMGLAALSSLGEGYAESLRSTGVAPLEAQLGALRIVFGSSALLVFAAAVVSMLAFRAQGSRAASAAQRRG